MKNFYLTSFASLDFILAALFFLVRPFLADLSMAL